MEELKAENPQYSKVDIRIIDEEKEPEATKLFLLLCMTYFLNGEKLHEGVPTKEIVRGIFEKALSIKHD